MAYPPGEGSPDHEEFGDRGDGGRSRAPAREGGSAGKRMEARTGCRTDTGSGPRPQGKPNASNKYRALLSVMFTYAVRKGLHNANPVTEVAGASEKKRDRYITDAELEAVRAAALLGNDNKPTPSGLAIVALIDLAYLTAQRIGDLLALNWADVSDEGIMFHPAKTVNSSGVRMLIEMTPDLQATLDAAKAGKVKAIDPVICTQSGGRFTYSGAQTAWKRACQRAEAEVRESVQ